MELTVWTYEGPPHVGAIRIANSMRGVHLVLHAPQGDSYADLLFTMIERARHRPPVTYTTFQARDLGGDTADLVLSTLREPASATSPRCSWSATPAPRNCCRTSPAHSPGQRPGMPVVPMEMLAYSRKENWGASETFYTLVRALLQRRVPAPGSEPSAATTEGAPSVNLLGPSSPRVPLPRRRARDHPACSTGRVSRQRGGARLGASPGPAAPAGGRRQRLPLPGVAGTAPATGWHATFKQPTIRTVPIGVGATATSSTRSRGAARYRRRHRPRRRPACPGIRAPWIRPT
jgi:light-independent protochlorophyllide reductase subunit B